MTERHRTGAYAAVAVVSLGLAAWSVRQPAVPEAARRDVVVLPIEPEQLETVRFDQGPAFLELFRRSGDARVWMRVFSPETKTEQYVAGPVAEKLFLSFAPLRTSRDLGVVAKEKLITFGLHDPRAHVTVVSKTGTTRFAAGVIDVNRESYLQADNGRVYGFENDALPVPHLARGVQDLIEKRLHRFAWKDVTELVVEADGRRAKLVVSNWQGQNRSVARPEAPDRPDRKMASWLSQLEGLRVENVHGVDKAMPFAPLVTTLNVDLFQGKRPLGFVELARGSVPPEAPPGTPPPPAVFARSENIGFWAEAQGAEEIVKDGRGFLGLD